jgi:hypothetical protein
MIMNMLFDLLDRVTLGRHGGVAELHHEPRASDPLPVEGGRLHNL